MATYNLHIAELYAYFNFFVIIKGFEEVLSGQFTTFSWKFVLRENSKTHFFFVYVVQFWVTQHYTRMTMKSEDNLILRAHLQ